ncbi:MAG TPA: ester cyclase [Polyangia bacterium]|nr:ester cyclase [Polyangia bacterium]
MNTEEKKQLVRRYYDEVWSRGNVALIDELMTKDYVNDDPATPGRRIQGREAFKHLVTTLRGAFQEMKMTIKAQHAEGDVVVTEWSAHAFHRGTLNGIPPTGKEGTTTGVTISTFAGNQIAEDRAIWDLFGLLRQVGVIPI